MKSKTNQTVLIIAIILMITCCLCLIAAVIGILLLQPGSSNLNIFSNKIDSTAQSSTPIAVPTSILSTEAVIPDAVKTEQSLQMLQTLEDTIVPVNDLKDLAARLQGKTQIADTIPAPAAPLKAGATADFEVTNTDDNNTFQVSAKLAYSTDHLYFWVQDGVQYDSADLKALCNTFEQKIYPTDREFFGSEWTPGVDNDPHLYILLASNLGSNLAGYFSSSDEYTLDAQKYSNQHEMFMLNADNIVLSDDFTYGVLAHEFQHMIHWYQDRNEETWLNEGFSELAAFLNGYDVGGFDYLFTENPDIQLTDWPNDSSATDVHYGASFLFLDYFMNRFGDTTTQAVVSDKDNGLVSIDKILVDEKVTDPQTGNQVMVDDVFADWVATNFINDGRVGDGRYVYKNYPNVPTVASTETISDCPADSGNTDVSQYGADYITILCPGDHTMTIQGVNSVGILPENPYSGSYAFWSNKGDESDMMLTRDFDFTNTSGSIEMNYMTWYDLEKDYDFVYLEASTDGTDWTIIHTPTGTDDNVSGNNYDWGYNGASDQWIRETVDLSEYAGKKVSVRFEYITDAAVNGEGFMIDDISVPAIDYASDFEQDNGDWKADGFVRMENQLPQTYRVEVIRQGSQTSVENIVLDNGKSVQIPITIGNGVNSVTVAISGTTRFTRQPANYSYSIQ
jgi:hypothetical protein